MDDLLNIQAEDNTGGLTLIQFAPWWFLATFSPLVFNEGYAWINVYCTSESMKFSEKTSDDNNLGFQTITITGDLPKIRSDVHASILKYRLHNCIVQCPDLNGNLRLAGNLQELLRFSDQSDTGAAAADANHYTLSWIGKTRFPALFIS